MMEERRLSSAGTLAYKFFLPILSLVPLGAWGILEVVYDPKNCLLSLAVFATIAAVNVVWYLPLKQVTATPRGLRISNYLTTVTVPYEHVLRVHELKWLNIRPITIVLKRACKFGRKVRFMPRGQFLLLFWRDHPVASWLRETCESRVGRGW